MKYTYTTKNIVVTVNDSVEYTYPDMNVTLDRLINDIGNEMVRRTIDIARDAALKYVKDRRKRDEWLPTDPIKTVIEGDIWYGEIEVSQLSSREYWDYCVDVEDVVIHQ